MPISRPNWPDAPAFEVWLILKVAKHGSGENVYLIDFNKTLERQMEPNLKAPTVSLSEGQFSADSVSALKRVWDGSNGPGRYCGAELVYDWCTRVRRREGVARTKSILAKQSHSTAPSVRGLSQVLASSNVVSSRTSPMFMTRTRSNLDGRATPMQSCHLTRSYSPQDSVELRSASVEPSRLGRFMPVVP